jgi:hypothetical protein
MADLSLLGGLIIASADTEGKPSLGWRGRRAAHRVTEAVTAALPSAVSASTDNDLTDKLTQSLHTARARGAELVESAKDIAQDQGSELVETARKRGKKARSALNSVR